MPTALERKGDFTQSLDVNGKLIPVTNPSTGRPYPGNIVPATDLNPNGLALLKSLALQNFTNRAISGGNYNYQIQEVLTIPSEADHRLCAIGQRSFLRERQNVALAAARICGGGRRNAGRLFRAVLLLYGMSGAGHRSDAHLLSDGRDGSNIGRAAQS